MADKGDVTIRTTCPRDCYDSCGIVVTPLPSGSLRVAGDPDHPVARGALCAKCGVAYNGVFQDPGARLTTPLRRTGRRGSGEYEPVSWDAALGEIADRLGAAIAASGPESVLTMQYSGTMSLLASAFTSRFVNAINASEVDYGTICNRAGFVAWELLFGGGHVGFDPRTAKDAAAILVWGANPAHAGPHAHKHWLRESPAKTIVVDPVRTRTAKDADLHLAPRPGTDAALAFALLNALDDLGAFDTDFIAGHVVGLEEIRDDIARATPEWGEDRTGVSAASIREAARLYAAGPALLWCGQALQRQPRGGNIMRAVGLLPALTGNVGKPGAGFYYVNDVAEIAGIDTDYLEGTALRSEPGKVVGALELAERLGDPDEFAAFVVWNTNPLASAADPVALRKALGRKSLFTVAIELFMTDTARYADIVLPAASFLEFDDLVAGYFNYAIGIQAKAREPLGEALPNQTIFRRLSRAMGLDAPALHEPDEDVLAELLRQVGYPGTFDDLRVDGTIFVNGDEPVIAFEDLDFATPSGRIEIASEKAESMGLPRVPEPAVDAPPRDGWLRLLSPASEWRLNDSYANDPRLRKRSAPAEIHLNPDDAARFGVAAGEPVSVGNERGALTLTAVVSDAVRPGTAMSYKGRWPSLEAGGNNLNLLYDGARNDMGESTAVHGVEVRVTPAG